MSKKSRRAHVQSKSMKEKEWLLAKLKTPDNKLLILRATAENIIHNWADGIERNLEWKLSLPIPTDEEKLRVSLYENPKSGLVQIVFVPAPNDEDPEDTLPNGDFLVAISMPVNAPTAGWLAASWMARWVKDVGELKSMIERLRVGRAAPKDFEPPKIH